MRWSSAAKTPAVLTRECWATDQQQGERLFESISALVSSYKPGPKRCTSGADAATDRFRRWLNDTGLDFPCAPTDSSAHYYI